MRVIFIGTLLLFGVVSAEEILVFLPIATKSHRNVFDPLITALAERGHHLTVVSPHEAKNSLPNVTEVVPVKYSEIFEEFQDPFDQRRKGKVSSVFSSIQFIYPASEKIIQTETFQNLFKKQYDLILYNGFLNYCFECLLYKLGTPVISITTMAAPNFMTTFIGNRLPTSFVPLPFLNLPDRMTFSQRLLNFFVTYSMVVLGPLGMVPKFEAFNKKFVGDDCPYPDAFPKNVSMIFSNSFFALTYPRPLLPDHVEVGGMHCRPAKPLPKELGEFLTGAKDGFIYFSMGSVVNTDTFPEEYRLKFLNVFSRLKQRVLWKWNSGHMDGLPSNVKVSIWIPQQDVLGHPNIRVFITHGGLLSTQEAAYHGVPLLGIPVFADQDLNMRQAETNGYALTLEILDFTEEKLESLLKKLLDNPQYLQKARQLSQVFRDQPQTPLERAVFWTEYVLRHKGAPQLRSAARNLGFFQYFCIDVIAFILAILIGAISVIVFSCKFCYRTLCTSRSVGSAKKKQ